MIMDILEVMECSVCNPVYIDIRLLIVICKKVEEYSKRQDPTLLAEF